MPAASVTSSRWRSSACRFGNAHGLATVGNDGVTESGLGHAGEADLVIAIGDAQHTSPYDSLALNLDQDPLEADAHR